MIIAGFKQCQLDDEFQALQQQINKPPCYFGYTMEMANSSIRGVLTAYDMRRLREQMSCLKLEDDRQVIYGLVDKESNTGLFKNERLLILNTKERKLGYLSKLPQNMIPFRSQQEVGSQKLKQFITKNEIYQDNVNKFSCQPIEGKNAIKISLNKRDKQIQWTFLMNNEVVTKEWINNIGKIFNQWEEMTPNQKAKKSNIWQSPIYPKQFNQSNVRDDDSRTEKAPSAKQKQIHRLGVDSASKAEVDIKYAHSPHISTPKSSVMNTPHHPYHLNMQFEATYSEILDNYAKSNPATTPKEHFAKPFTIIEVQSDRDNFFSRKSSIRKDDTRRVKQQRMIRRKSQEESESIRENITELVRYNTPDVLHFLLDKRKTYDEKYEINRSDDDFKDWNKMFYQSKTDRAAVYFSFVDECVDEITDLIDKLPITKSLFRFDKVNGFYRKCHQGVQYIIACKEELQNSRLNSSHQGIQPKNEDLCIKLQQKFHKHQHEFERFQKQQPCLAVLIDYKGIMSFCKALDSDSTVSFKSKHTDKITTKCEDQLLNKLENMQTHITSSMDFKTIKRKMDVIYFNWSYLYKKCGIKPYKKIILNEIYSDIFLEFLRGELCFAYQHFPIENFQSIYVEIVEEVMIDCIVMLVNRLFGTGEQTQQFWSFIFKKLERDYMIQARKESVLPSYLIFSILQKLGLRLNSRIRISNNQLLFEKRDKIDSDNVTCFNPVIHCLKYEKMTPQLSEIANNLIKDPSQTQNHYLQELISQLHTNIPDYINYLKWDIKLRFSNTKPYELKEKSANSQIYDIVKIDTPYYEGYQIALSAINWCFYSGHFREAEIIATRKIKEILFWVGKIPLLSYFYDALAWHYRESDNLEKALENQELSLSILSELLDENHLKVLEKKIKLSDLHLQLNNVELSLQILEDCRRIFSKSSFKDKQIEIDILLQISKITLSLGKYNDSLGNALQILRKSNIRMSSSKQDPAVIKGIIQASQILIRSLQLTNRRKQTSEFIGICLRACKYTKSAVFMKRLLKNVMFPYLKDLNQSQSSNFSGLVIQMEQVFAESNLNENKLFELLKNIDFLAILEKKIGFFFKSISLLSQPKIKEDCYEQLKHSISNWMDYPSKTLANDRQSFLYSFFIIVNFVGTNFIHGMLSSSYA